MGLTDSPTCERCLEKDELATHILCDCEARAYLRFRQLGHYLMEPGDYWDAHVSKILHFIQSIGLLKGWNRGWCTTDHWRPQCKGQSRPTLYAFIHPFIHSFVRSFMIPKYFLRKLWWLGNKMLCKYLYLSETKWKTDTRIMWHGTVDCEPYLIIWALKSRNLRSEKQNYVELWCWSFLENRYLEDQVGDDIVRN
jgi:hypothetical protein